MRTEIENVVQTVELTKIFKDFWGRARVKALDRLNLDIRRGEVFGLLGPNGSGKTTTVRLILGLLFPTRGAISLFGKSPRNVDIKRRIGYMPEESHLYEYLDAYETLEFFGRLFGLERGERRRRSEALIEMVGLQRAGHRAIREYSKGMARRIGLAQSLINDPDLLILDEPTTGLDPVGSREIKDLIVMLKERGKTVFLCSHLLADVEEVCDRICILYGGKQRALGEVQDLLTRKEMTQIRTPRLSQDVLERVKSVIRESSGEEVTVEVGSPSARLEEFFLSVVDSAREERLTTAGAERGLKTADFLVAREAEGEELVQHLVAAVEQQPEEERREPVAALASEEDQHVLDDLLMRGERQQLSGEQATEEPAVAVPSETEVHRDLIDELTAGSEQAEGDEQQEEPTDETEAS